MAAITTPQIVAVFDSAVRVYDDPECRPVELETLVNSHNINKGSATAFIQNYRCMRAGQRYTRAQNDEATAYFLDQIETRFGHSELQIALEAVRKHLVYYEALGKGKLQYIRRILATYAEQDFDFAQVDKIFRAEIDDALKLTSSQRIAKLTFAPKLPQKMLVSSYVYLRNPLVVADALARSNGKCEVCQKPAPFARRSNGTPYLEIHHRQRLADDGEDTLENVFALCPNCHRKAHFG
jgi:5-methylcytosine-specific restriction enzyme A